MSASVAQHLHRRLCWPDADCCLRTRWPSSMQASTCSMAGACRKRFAVQLAQITGHVFDLVLNVVAYVPFGAMLAGQFARRMVRHAGGPDRIAHRGPWRVVVDQHGTDANDAAATRELAAGCVHQRPGHVGWGRIRLERCGPTLAGAPLRARDRWMLPSACVRKAGVILCLAWLFAQLNPLVPLFDAGEFAPPRLANGAHDPYELWVYLPFAFGTLLNACAFALFLSLVLRPGRFLLAGVTPHGRSVL